MIYTPKSLESLWRSDFVDWEVRPSHCLRMTHSKTAVISVTLKKQGILVHWNFWCIFSSFECSLKTCAEERRGRASRNQYNMTGVAAKESRTEGGTQRWEVTTMATGTGWVGEESRSLAWSPTSQSAPCRGLSGWESEILSSKSETEFWRGLTGHQLQGDSAFASPNRGARRCCLTLFARVPALLGSPVPTARSHL